MNNPIIERELIGTLRTRKAAVLLIGLGVAFALLIIVRWPSDARVELNGAQSRAVFKVFGYGLLTSLLFLAPVFPANSIVREKNQGTLELLLNSTMGPLKIYFGKLVGVLGFVLLLLMMSVPSAAACYVMGGVSLTNDIGMLYGLLAIIALQCTTLSLMVSSYVNSNDSALRMTYGAVLGLAVLTLGPHLFLQGSGGLSATIADWLRCFSPIAAMMEVLGHGDIGGQGRVNIESVASRYYGLALTTSLGFAGVTISRLNHRIFDTARDQGQITDELNALDRVIRRMIFIVDPQRRKSGIGLLTNPIMVKEFRCRRFGRLSWTIRLVLVCAVISLTLTWATTMGTVDWGVETIGGIMVLLQVALIVLLTPSIAAGLISTEIESGGWDLLRMTPLSTGVILRGKLMSVVWTLLLILLATLPGYGVMILIKPGLLTQVVDVMRCLLLTAVFALALSAAVSSLTRTTAAATVATTTGATVTAAGPIAAALEVGGADHAVTVGVPTR
ncbi:MAG: ABC transporter permease subunit, partial [Planctomycetaceae bacterium]